MSWSFYASLWVVGVTYSSTLNETHWKTRETVEVDDCGPSNMSSPGYALWLALVPAVACVVQLPGSVILYGRSNLYRLSPEMGLADALATLNLVVGALWKGYTWREAVTAVLLVREGIGRADLWWSEDRLADEEPPPYEEVEGGGTGSSAVDVSTSPSPPDPPTDPFEEYRIQARISPYAGPLTIERTMGGLLFIIALIKAITVLSTAGAGSVAVLIPAVLAIGYSSSFIILEVLVWSLSFPAAGYSVADIPQRNLLEVLRFVDPGRYLLSRPNTNNERPTTQDPAVELGSISYADQESAQTQHIEFATTVPRSVGVTFFASIAVVCTCLSWLALLYNVWRFSRAVVATSVACIVAVLGSHLAANVWRALAPSGSCLPVQALHAWLGRYATIVHVLPLLWVITICTYIVLAFPQEGSEQGDRVLRKPAWLDWLG